MKSRSPRARCVRKIVGLVGEGGLQAFLAAPQPALDDRTGVALLQNAPRELLRRLEALEAEREAAPLDIDPVALDRPPAMKSGRETARVLRILDQLQPGGEG